MATATLDPPRSRAPSPPSWDAVAPFAAAGLIVLVAALNVAYLHSDPPLELAPDEAHYWDWSRRLDWCYYSKGPLVAWLIRASRELFAGWSVAAVGTELVAVRLPAVLCQALLLWALYLLAARTLGRPRLGLATVAAAVTLPPVAATGLLMTIDSPFLACWAWACVFAHSAILREGGTRSWAAAGAMVAVGVLAKYTMLAFPASVLGYLLADPVRRRRAREPGLWLFLALGAIGLVPIVLWNWRNEWVGFRHLFALANGPADEPKPLLSPLGPLAFVGGQAAFLLGFWFVAVVATGWANRPGRAADPGRELLWWLAAPVWLVFLAASLRTPGELSWAAPAYVAGLVLAVGWVAGHPSRVRAAVASGAIGVFVIVCAHYPGPWRSLLAGLTRPTADRPAPVRRFDPTCRLAGWRTLAAEVDRLREEVVREDGEEPVIATMVWSSAGEIAFYSRGNPQVVAVGSAIADRRSQYDVWRPNPLRDAQAFRARTFLYVGEAIPQMEQVFDRVGSPVEVIASDGGIPVAAWKVWVCRGYRGFPDGGGRRSGPGY